MTDYSLDVEQNQLFQEYLPYMDKFKRLHGKFEYAWDGLYGSLLDEGLIRAVKSYKVDRGSFKNHLHYWLLWSQSRFREAMKTMYAKCIPNKVKLKTIPADKLFSTLQKEHYFDIAVENNPCELIDTVDFIQKGFSRLDDRSKLILTKWFFEYATDREIATQIGVTKATVFRIRNQSLEQLRALAG